MTKLYNKIIILICLLLLSSCSSDNIKKCGANSSFDGEKCQCNEGYQFDDNNNCKLVIDQSSSQNKSYIHFLDTGNSDSIIIQFNGKTAIIDGGENDDEDYVVSYLKKLNVSTIDLLQMSHTDADHVGGLDAVVKNFTINEVLVSNGKVTTTTYKDFINTLANKNLQPAVPLDGSKLIWGENTYFQFFNTKEVAADPNDMSIITLFVNGNDKFLFTGDAGIEQENKYVEMIGKVNVFKAGHHGSYTSNGEKLISYIKPEFAVITCGADNKYGHPHRETLDIFQKYDIKIYRTDLNGDIVFESTGNKVILASTTKNLDQINITTQTNEQIPSNYIFKNCDEVWKYFPNGFSKQDYPTLYEINKAKDKDRDGYACER